MAKYLWTLLINCLLLIQPLKSRRYIKSGTNKVASLMQLHIAYLKHMILIRKHKRKWYQEYCKYILKKKKSSVHQGFVLYSFCFTPSASRPLTDLQYFLFTPSHFEFNALWLVYFQLLLVFLWEYHI